MSRLNEVRRNAKGEVVFESQWFGPQIILPRGKRISNRECVRVANRCYHSAELADWHGRKVLVETMPWDNSVVHVYDTKGREICAAQLDGHLESTKSVVDEIKKAFGLAPRFPRADWISGYTLTRLGGKWRLAFVDNLYYRSFYADSYSELEAQLVRWLRS